MKETGVFFCGFSFCFVQRDGWVGLGWEEGVWYFCDFMSF